MIDIEALSELEKNASGGDWFGKSFEVYSRSPKWQHTIFSNYDPETGLSWGRPEDASFVAAARNAIPALLAELRAARLVVIAAKDIPSMPSSAHRLLTPNWPALNSAVAAYDAAVGEQK